MTAKLTVVYAVPEDPEAFDKHYNEVHIPIAGTVSGVQKAELSKVYPKEDGTKAPAYRIAELYFADYDAACAAIATEQGQKLVNDAVALGSAGVQFLLSEVE